MRDDVIVRFLSAGSNLGGGGFKLEFSSCVVSATAGEAERLQCRSNSSDSNPVVTVAPGGLSLSRLYLHSSWWKSAITVCC